MWVVVQGIMEAIVPEQEGLRSRDESAVLCRLKKTTYDQMYQGQTLKMQMVGHKS